ncbi:MAG: antibiotic biosynthesis monooxygenase [Chroococcidiopsidaceae cyanobacterium CP_BM_RX_35]|nr:antibiotic biosynthesis monooxygenase [Chroococcidiopsidaceae cyanobacterium CP_BM_RX_35]
MTSPQAHLDYLNKLACREVGEWETRPMCDSINTLEGVIMNQLQWMVELEIKPGQEQAMRVLVAEMVSDVQANESGALDYKYNISQDGKCYLFERYVDGAATLAHLDAFNRVFATRFVEVFQPLRFVVYGLPGPEVREALTGFNPVYTETIGGFRR